MFTIEPILELHVSHIMKVTGIQFKVKFGFLLSFLPPLTVLQFVEALLFVLIYLC